MSWQAFQNLAPLLPVMLIPIAFILGGIYFIVKEAKLQRSSREEMRQQAMLAQQRTRALVRDSSTGKQPCGS